jgi:hypothetical protein
MNCQVYILLFITPFFDHTKVGVPVWINKDKKDSISE